MAHFKITDEAYWEMPEGLEQLNGQPMPTLRLACFPMGDVTDDPPAAMILKCEPGHTISHHAHACERVEIIVQGTLHVGDEVLGPGDVMTARPGEFYGPHVAGPDGCITLEIFGALSESYRPVYKDEGGGYIRADGMRGVRESFDLESAIYPQAPIR